MSNTTLIQTESTVVVQPPGDVVASSVPELRNVLKGALADRPAELVIDLTHVEMIDSTGIGLLISAHNSISRIGGKLNVVHASNDILELFRAMRIHQHFGISG